MDISFSSEMCSRRLNSGEMIKREQPLFARMPPDGVPGEPRDDVSEVAQDS